MFLTVINVFLPDSFVIGIHHLAAGQRLSAFQMIIRWFHFASFVVLPVAVTVNKKVFKKIAVYFCLPVSLIYMSLFSDIIKCYTSPLGTGIVDIRYLPEYVSSFMHNELFRGIMFFAICFAEIASILMLLIDDWTFIKFKKSEIPAFVAILLCSIITILPIYALEGIFNTFSNLIFGRFSALHISWILVLIAEGIILTLIFRKKSYEDRYIVVLILALSLFLQFNQLFSSLGELTCKRMPLQLCNLAAYIMLISVIFKSRNLFLFNLLINVAGGVIAMFVLDAETTVGILSKGNIHYIVEHHNVILAPILCMTLGIFKPITKKDFKHFAINFSIYYLCIFIIGTWFNAIWARTGSDYFYCNYLFMFDQATAARLIPFAGKLFDYKLNFGHMTVYPVIQPLIYITFFLIGTLSFFIFKPSGKQKTPKLPTSGESDSGKREQSTSLAL